MHRNLEWTLDLDIDYDSSTFDTDPFEPQQGGVSTIFPFYVSGNSNQKGYIELPYTLPQDFTLFVILRENSIDIWKRKLDWIAENGGMAMLNTHPDYMYFDGEKQGSEEYPVRYYHEFLNYVKTKYGGQYWHILPGDMSKILKKDTSANNVINAGKKRIWIDMDNSPHVPFFKPIFKELEKRGHDVMITARDCSQVCGIADLLCVEYERIGRHYGKNKVLKVLGTVVRALQLTLKVWKNKPQFAVSHGSRSQLLSALIMRIPSMVIMDYEHVKGLINIHPDYVLIPEIVPSSVINVNSARIMKYPGLKEDVYLSEFEPDPSIISSIGIRRDDLVVTVRPPATDAHYHNPESDKLFDAVMHYLSIVPGVCIVLLPRNAKQKDLLGKKFQSMFQIDKILIPDNAINGLDLMWYSDLVISGGGTMNREAAALGVPVYSIFRGELGAVDRHLSSIGKLTIVESVEDVPKKLKLVKRNPKDYFDKKEFGTIKSVVENIFIALDSSC